MCFDKGLVRTVNGIRVVTVGGPSVESGTFTHHPDAVGSNIMKMTLYLFAQTKKTEDFDFRHMQTGYRGDI